MSTKKSDFTSQPIIPSGATFDYVVNGQNFKLPKEDLLASLGVTGTIEQDGAATGTPVLDIDGSTNKIRNLESGPGVKSSVSPENGITLEHNILSGATGTAIFADITEAQPLIRSLISGNNITITVSDDGLRIDAALGAVPNTVIVQAVTDFPGEVAGVITLPASDPAVYVIKGIIDLGVNVIEMEGGNTITGDTAALSGITTNSSSPTVTALNGGGTSSSITASTGIMINNSGPGAAVRAQGSDTVFFANRINTTDAGNVLEIEDALFVVVDGWSMVGSVNGVVMTGTANNGPIITALTSSGLTGKGIFINGDIPTNGTPILILDSVLAMCAGNGIEVASSATIQGIGVTGNVSSSAAVAVKIAGTLEGGVSISGTNLLSLTDEGLDITGSTIAGVTVTNTGISSVAAGKAAVKGDAGSVNINTGSNAIFEVCRINNIADSTADPLSGITKKDLLYSFINAGSRITDSRTIGSFTLDAQATTTINFQGDDGSITAFADSATSPGVETTVSTTNTPASGAPVAVFGTTSYNGLFTAANVVGGVSFDIVRVFVADDATGSWESGWVKIAGATTAGSTIERFDLPNDNELRSLDVKTIPVTYTSVIAGQKVASTPRLMEFALFCDQNDSNGFVKINGSSPRDITNRSGSLVLRIPAETVENSLFTSLVRNTEGTEDFICDSLTTDVGLS